MIEKLEQFFSYLHTRGLAIPLIRDPKINGPSVSLTILVIATIMVLIGLIGKWSKLLDVDVSGAIYFFMVAASLYFGRTISGNKSSATLTTNNESEGK